MPFIFKVPPAPISADNPKFWAKLDETSGTASANDGFSTTTGTYVNSPTLGDPPLINTGTSVTFNGANQYVDFPSTAVNQFYDFTFTMEAWIKTTDISNAPRIFAAGNASINNDQGFMWRVLPSGDLNYITNVGSIWRQASTTTSPISNNIKYHIAFKFNANNWVRFYVNGAFIEQISFPYATQQTKSWPATIGANYENGRANFFAGTIDNVLLFDYLLDDSRIMSHYVNTL